MSVRLFSVIALLCALVGCQKKKGKKDVIHAPEQVLISSPLTLAGNSPAERDEDQFQACIRDSMVRCDLPYLNLASGSREAEIDSVLSYTLISHDWQKTRLRNFLQEVRPELLSMLTCVKAVVVAGEIRPSFYHSRTGAIYLDAANFAMDAAEIGTVTKRPDARTENFEQIDKVFFTVNTIRGGTHEERRRRQLEQLFAHELAHACDFKSFAQTGAFISDELPAIPENPVFHMAQWLYFGDQESKARLQSFTPAEIGKSFEDGPIIDIYGYGNQFEHLAMIVESHLDFEFFGNNRIDMLTDNPTANDQDIRDFPIHWGMTGKFCQPDLFEMGRGISEKVLPTPITWLKTQADCTTTVHTPGVTVRDLIGG